ncbi:MAG: GIY-YIG nuclease family protein [Rickettsiales bacterium]|nr:GIY-YIG nuclease family protein [Rickettsiales bacterium]
MAKGDLMYYVYILQSKTFPDKFYAGQTDDLKNRLQVHNSGYSLATKPYIPWKIISYHAFIDKDTALRFERYLKSGSGQAFSKRHFKI